ncbi:hypothetical protein X798_07602, partial [Onchocerca flexuosa]
MYLKKADSWVKSFGENYLYILLTIMSESTSKNANFLAAKSMEWKNTVPKELQGGGNLWRDEYTVNLRERIQKELTFPGAVERP